MANLSSYLKKQYAAQQEQALAELKGAYDKNGQAIDEQAAEIPAQYEAAKNEAAVQTAVAKKNFNEQAAATGLNSGTSGQAELARSNAYMSALSNLNRGEADAQQALERDRLALQTDYENAIAAQKAATNAALQNALYQEMVRQSSYSGGGPKKPVVDYTYKDKIWNTPSAEELYDPNASYSNVVRTIQAAMQSGQEDYANRLASAYYNNRPEWQEDLKKRFNL